MIGEKISLAKGTPLEKSNAIIEKFIEYATAHPEFLVEEGIIRQSGNTGKVDEIYKIANEDPAQFDFENHKDFTLEPHNVVGVLKRYALTDGQWSPGAVAIIQNELLQEQFDLDIVVQQLIDNNHLEEAKMLHNILHIGHLTALKSKQNKMTPANLFVVMGPWLARMANGDAENGLDIKMAMNAVSTAQSEDPMGVTKERYGRTFDNAHKEVALKVERAHQEISKRASVVIDKGQVPESIKSDSKKRSFKIPSFVRKAIDWTRNTAIPAVTQFITKKLPSWLGRITGRITGSKAKELTPVGDKMAVHPELTAAKEQAEKARKEEQARQALDAQRQREEQARRESEAQVRVSAAVQEQPRTPPPRPARPASITPGKITEEERTHMQNTMKEKLSFWRELEQKVKDKVNSPKGRK